MTLIDIEQQDAAWLMCLFGVLELVTRVLMSVFGDYIKGHVLDACIVFYSGLAVVHAIAANSHTFLHMLLFTIGISMCF